MDVDTSELREWSATLNRAADECPEEVKKVVGRGMLNMKKDAQARVRGHVHLPHLARSFTYDVVRRGDVITGEIGAERGRLQGKLDVFIEYGTPTSAPIPHWAPALEAEGPRFEKALGDLGVDLIEKS